MREGRGGGGERERQKVSTPRIPAQRRARAHTRAHAHARARTRTHAHARTRTRTQVPGPRCLVLLRPGGPARAHSARPARRSPPRVTPPLRSVPGRRARRDRHPDRRAVPHGILGEDQRGAARPARAPTPWPGRSVSGRAGPGRAGTGPSRPHIDVLIPHARPRPSRGSAQTRPGGRPGGQRPAGPAAGGGRGPGGRRRRGAAGRCRQRDGSRCWGCGGGRGRRGARGRRGRAGGPLLRAVGGGGAGPRRGCAVTPPPIPLFIPLFSCGRAA
jgi:translation initiation factor IF-2